MASTADSDTARIEDSVGTVTDVNRLYRKSLDDDHPRDLCLISSDGLRFRVHRALLIAASSTFRQLLSTGAGIAYQDEISFTDSFIENSKSVRFALDLIHTRQMLDSASLIRPNGDILILNGAVKFLQKYDFDAAINYLRTCIRCWALDDFSLEKFSAFLAGALLGEVETCALAIQNGGTLVFIGRSKANVTLRIEDFVAGGLIFDIASWSSSHLEVIPSRYILALVRAQQSIVLKDAEAKDWKDIADRFRLLAPEPTAG